MKAILSGFVLSCLLTTEVLSQNLVPNPSFEAFTNCPTGNSQFPNNVPPWVNPTGSGTTPDYFNSCAGINPGCNYVDVPDNFAGSIPAFEGDAYAGVIGYYTSCPNCREYVQVQLTSPLSAGIKYHLAMRVRLASQSYYYCTGMGMFLSDVAPSQPGNQPINTATPQLEDVVGINDTLAWTLMATDYIATGGEDYVTIGIFKDNAQLTITTLGTSTGSCALVTNCAFYLIDSVSVAPFVPAVNYANTCFGDSTLFSVYQSPLLIAVAWNFGDTASGVNNDAYTYNTPHLFTSPGAYTVTTINYYLSGLNDTIYSNIIINPLPNINLGNDTSLCTGDSILLDAGNGFTSYQWSTGNTQSTIIANSAGNYAVMVTDGNGCSNTDTISITLGICAPIISLSSSDSSFCEKQCIDFFDLSTNAPTSWQWYFPGAVPDTSSAQNPNGICYNSYGSFTVKLVACNNLGCDSIIFNNFINEYQNPTDSVFFSNDTLWSLPFPSYQWYEVTNGIIQGATNQYFIASDPGSYYCVVNDSIGCIGTSNILVATSLNQLLVSDLELQIQPNPNNGTFDIVWPSAIPISSDNIQLRIIDALGRVIFNSGITGFKSGMHLAMDDGIYFLHVICGNTVYYKKFAVEK